MKKILIHGYIFPNNLMEHMSINIIKMRRNTLLPNKPPATFVRT